MPDFDFSFLNSPNFGALGGAKEAADISLSRANTAKAQADVPLEQAQTEKLNLENAEAKNFARALSSMGGGPATQGQGSQPGSPPAFSYQLAQMGMAARDNAAPMHALELFKAAATAKGAEATQALKQQEQLTAQMKQHQDVLNRVGGMAQQVLDTDSGASRQLAYEAMIQRALQDPTLRAEALKMPALVAEAEPQLKMLVGESEKAGQQINQVLRAQGLGQQAQNEQNREVMRSFIRSNDTWRREFDERRQADRDKNGGKDIGKPSPDDRKVATESIYRTVLPGFRVPKKGSETEDESLIMSQVEQAGTDVAAQAKDMVQKQPGLSYTQAVSRLIQQQQASGEWEVLKAAKGVLWDGPATQVKPGESVGQTPKVTHKPVGTKPTPTAGDIAYAKAHPEVAGKFKERFGVEP